MITSDTMKTAAITASARPNLISTERVAVVFIRRGAQH